MKTLLKILYSFIALSILFIAVVISVLFKPYLDYSFIKRSKLENIRVEWVAWACGDTYPRLTEIIDPDEKIADEPFFLSIAKGIPDPEESIASFPGNKFILRGYRVDRRVRNWFTGTVRIEPARQLYIIGWKVVIPYRLPIKSDNGIKYKYVSEPIEYSISDVNLKNVNFIPTNSQPCL